MTTTLLYDITKQCNLHCSHCYNGDYYSRESFDRSILPVVKFINLHDIGHVHILGGEPFCSPYLFDFVQCLKNQTISINTNGTLLSEEKINKILNHKNITQLTISLDGHNAETNDCIRGKGVFNLVYENLRKLKKLRKKSQLDVNLAFVAMPSNLHSLIFIPDLCDFFSINCLMISFLYNEGNARAIIEEYKLHDLIACLLSMIEKNQNTKTELLIDLKPNMVRLLKILSPRLINISTYETGCYANKAYYYIDADLQLFPCSPSAKSNSKLYKICNLEEENLDRKRTILINNSIYNNEICRTCFDKKVCIPCPIHCDTCNINFCEEVNSMLRDILFNVRKRHILDSKDYQLVIRNEKLMLINFTKKYSVNLRFWAAGFAGSLENDFYKQPIESFVEDLEELHQFNFLFNIASLAHKGLLNLSN